MNNSTRSLAWRTNRSVKHSQEGTAVSIDHNQKQVKARTTNNKILVTNN